MKDNCALQMKSTDGRWWNYATEYNQSPYLYYRMEGLVENGHDPKDIRVVRLLDNEIIHTGESVNDWPETSEK